MRLRVFVVALLVTFGIASPASVATATVEDTTVATTTPGDGTVNEFLPADRDISDCISAVPKPGCGSKERGGWHQYLVLIAVAGGLGVIGWRVVSGVRRRPTAA